MQSHPQSASSTQIEPELLLFDLGGVLIDIDFERAFRAWQPMSQLSLDEIRRNFGFDLPYQRHERGEIAAAEYFDHLASLLRLQASQAEIAAGWNAIFIREIRQTVELVRTARSRLACHAFTNTNAAHQAAWSAMFPDVVAAVDGIFASHEMGCRKPERRAFEHIARATGVALGSILFFDDTLENVQGAAAAGLQAVHVRSPADVKQALARAGVVPA
jgi:HAD superfamily hydrolase (TIGR01509 family)